MFSGRESQGQSTLEPQFQASIVPITQRQPIEERNPVALSSQMIGFYPTKQQDEPQENVEEIGHVLESIAIDDIPHDFETAFDDDNNGGQR